MVIAVTKWMVTIAVAAGAAALTGCAPTKTGGAAAPPALAGGTRAAAERQAPGAAIPWLMSYEEALQQAKQQGKPVMVDVMASWCGACKKLEAEVWSRADVAAVAKRFVPAKVDGELRPEVRTKYSVSGYPTTLFVSPAGKEIGRVRGVVTYDEMLEAMRDALKAAPQGR